MPINLSGEYLYSFLLILYIVGQANNIILLRVPNEHNDYMVRSKKNAETVFVALTALIRRGYSTRWWPSGNNLG